jgi:hypothetical protein
MCSSSPDMTAANTAAAASAKTGEEALKWYQSVYADEAPLREASAARANAVSDAQLEAMKVQTGIARDTNDYNVNTFRPLEQGIVTDARNFDTEAERERLAGLARGDVAENFDSATQQAERDLARRGVNPNDGRFGSTIAQLGITKALAGADAATKSRMSSIQLGRAMKMDAASLGRGLPSQQATATSLALNAGSSSAATGAMPLTQAQQAASQVGAGFDAAQRGYSTSGNIYGNTANVQAGVDNSNSQTAGSAGAAVGTIAVLI